MTQETRLRVASNPTRGWQANKKTHLCVASGIRAMPETEKPPAMRGDIYCAVKVIRLVRFQGRQGGFMSSKAQTREKDYERGIRIADRRKAIGL